MTVYKHVFRLVVLNEEDIYDPDTLAMLEEDITEGDSIGDWRLESSVLVPEDNVRAELIAIGNDGTFFDLEDEPEDASPDQ